MQLRSFPSMHLVNILIIAPLVVPYLAYGGTLKCINSETGATYIASQGAIGDKCVLVSADDPYAADRKAAAERHQAEINAIVAKAERDEKAAKRDAVQRARLPGVTIGMTEAQAKASSWGRPMRINRTINANGTREQWVYGGNNYLYFENGVLVSIQN